MDYQLIIAGDIGWSVTQEDIQYALGKLKGQHVDCKIASLGGSLYDALDIYQMFRDHGDVTAYLSGLVASAATIIAMGAKEVKMYDTSLMLIHKCLGYVDVYGHYNSDDLDTLLKDLKGQKDNQDLIDTIIARIYARKSGCEMDDVLELMAENRWMDSTEAVDLKLVDAVVGAPEGDRKAPQNIVNYLKGQGMPVPSGYRFEKTAARAQDGEPSPSFVAKCAAMLRDLFAPSQSAPQTEPKTTMLTDFTNINAVLNVEGLEDTDGAVQMSNEQLRGIESVLADNQVALDEANARIAQLQSQVEALQKAPGDETKSVEDAEVEELTALQMFNLVKDL